MRLQRWLFDHFRAVGASCGFEEYDAPVLERQELYKRKAGEEITQQMYSFTDKEDTEVTLRPEMTPSLARMVLGRAQSHSLPLKWFSVPQCWRFETTQRGRKREHYQWNMDIIGCAGIAAEVELLSAIVQFFKAIGITHEDIGIKVNSRKVMASVLKAMGVTDDKFAPVCVVMDKMDKIGPEETKKELVATQGLDAETAEKIVSCLLCKSVDDLAALCGDGVDTSGVDELKRLFELAADYGFGDWLVFDASVVRGLAYYTGVVFEGFDRAGELRAICGGGRYDRLLSLYGAVTEVPACGFGFGDCVVVELLKDKGILPNLPKRVDFVVAAFNESMQGAAMKTTALLRDGGAQVDLLLEPKKKVANTFDYANRAGARYIVFVAPAEWEKGTVRVKDLRLGEETPDEEKQIDVKLEDLGRVREVLDAWALARGVGKVAV
jgi:histidyl-tRNA synthetase